MKRNPKQFQALQNIGTHQRCWGNFKTKMTTNEEIKEEINLLLKQFHDDNYYANPQRFSFYEKVDIDTTIDLAIRKTMQKMEKTHISLKLHKAMQDENFEQRKQIIDLTNKLSKAKAEDRKEFAEWIEDMSCHDAPNLCQCCQDINEKLQKEVKQ